MLSEINEKIKVAMKDQNKNILSTLRILKSDMVMKAKESMISDGELDSPTFIGVVSKTLKKYQEELEFVKDEIKVGNLRESISFLEGYMPKQLTKEEVREIVGKAVAEFSNIGSIMKQLSTDLKGKTEMKDVKTMVDELIKNKQN